MTILQDALNGPSRTVLLRSFENSLKQGYSPAKIMRLLERFPDSFRLAITRSIPGLQTGKYPRPHTGHPSAKTGTRASVISPQRACASARLSADDFFGFLQKIEARLCEVNNDISPPRGHKDIVRGARALDTQQGMVCLTKSDHRDTDDIYAFLDDGPLTQDIAGSPSIDDGVQYRTIQCSEPSMMALPGDILIQPGKPQTGEHKFARSESWRAERDPKGEPLEGGEQIRFADTKDEARRFLAIARQMLR